MKNETVKKRTIVSGVKLLNVILVTLPFAFVWIFHYTNKVYLQSFYRKGNWLVIALFFICYYLLTHLYGGFAIHTSRISDLIYSQTLAAVLTNALELVVMWLLFRRFPNVWGLVVTLCVQIVIIGVWSYLSHHWYFRTFPAKKTVIIWEELPGMESLVKDYGMEQHFNIIRSMPVGECMKAGMEQVLQDAEVVFLCSIHSHERNQIVKYCVQENIAAYCVPRIGDVIMAGAEEKHLFHLPLLAVQRYNPTPEYLFFKRFFDITLSLIAIVLLSPLMLILAFLIRLDGGTAFYRQKRLTKDGKVFEVLKFRSMRMDAEKDGVARLSTGEKDDRITRVGHFIRACRMDELPQLFNILRGDMSIVGPRPERPEIAEQYEKELPEFRLRLQCKCGLTGLAQYAGKYNSTPYDKLLMDLMYIAKPSLAEDFRICLATLKILFMKESTEGVAEGRTTAEVGKTEFEGNVGQESVRKTV